MQEQLLHRIRRIEIHAKQHAIDLFSGMYHSIFKGRGIEPDDIREYEPGDDIRAISWSKTAQMGRPFVKNFREERDLTVVFMVDVSGSTDFTSIWETKRDRIAEVAATLAFSAIDNHDRVGLLLFSSIIEKYIPPKRGVRHGVRLIRELLSYSPKNRTTDIANALRFLNTLHKKHVICFLLSDFESPAYNREFLLTAKRHDLIAIRILDLLEQQLPKVGLIAFKDLETDEMRVVDLNRHTTQVFAEKRIAAKKTLERLAIMSNAGLIELDTKNSYYESLKNFFTIRQKRH